MGKKELIETTEEEKNEAPADCPDISKDFSGKDKIRFDVKYLLLPLIVLGVTAFLLKWGVANIGGGGKLIINEVVTNNHAAYSDSALGSPDYVELYNASHRTIRLNGYGVSNSMKNCYRYTLPDVSIEPGEYLLVFFTGGTQEADANPFCTGFGLDKKGDTVVLVDDNYDLLDSVEVPELPSDISYGRGAEGKWIYFMVPTPGSENIGKTLATLDTAGQISRASGLIFTEIVTNNHGCYKDSMKNSPDYIELYNGSGKQIDIGGCGIGFTADSRYEYVLPEKTLQPDEYILIAFTRDEDPGDTLRAEKNLSKNGGTFYLTDPDYILLDKVNVPYLPENISWERRLDLSWGYGLVPSPGRYNDGEITDEYTEASAE